MKEENIIKLIKKDKNELELPSVIYIYGQENLLKKQFIDKFKSSEKDFHFLWGDEINLSQLKDIFSSGALFSSGNIAVLWDIDSFISKLNKNQYQDFINILKEIPQGDLLFIVSLKEKIPSKEPYKSITKIAQIINSPQLTPKAFELSVYKKIKNSGKEIDIEDLKYLVSKLPRNLYNTKQEIEKLLTYTANKEKIEKKDIDAVVVSKPETNIFVFQAQLLNKDINVLKTLKILIENGQHPFEIQSFVLNILNKILLYKSYIEKGIPKSEAFAKMKINYRPQQVAIDNASQIWTKKEIINAIKNLYETEISQKVYYENIEQKLEEFILKLLL